MTFLIETIAAGDETVLKIIHVLFLSKVSDTEIGSDIYWKPWSFFLWFLLHHLLKEEGRGGKKK